jgi:hypothetical protein
MIPHRRGKTASMITPTMERYAHALRGFLASGALQGGGSVELADGLVVDLKRMVRITLAEVERFSSGLPGESDANEQRQLYDDLERLHTFAFKRSSAGQPRSAATSATILGLRAETVRRILHAGTLEAGTADILPASLTVFPRVHDAPHSACQVADEGLRAAVTAAVQAALATTVAEMTASRQTLERHVEEEGMCVQILTRLAPDLTSVRQTLWELHELGVQTSRTARTSLGLLGWLITGLVAGSAWWFFQRI